MNLELELEPEMALAAVSMKTALKYRRNWDHNSKIVKLLQSMMPVGPGKKGYRLYFDIGNNHKNHYTIPPAVRSALQKAGFAATDYLAKKCVKRDDKDQKNVFNIGKVIGKDAHAKAAFDNDPQLQNTKQGALQVVISCHPYDVIGMSTGRDWDKTSCMRLADGVHRHDPGSNAHYVRNDVAEGTLVAYVVSVDDSNIQRPKARCLLKPFYNEEGEVLYRRESRVYGNPVPGFDLILSRFLRRINAHIPDGIFKMSGSLYDDGMGRDHEHTASSDDNLTMLDVTTDTTHAAAFVAQQVAAMPHKDQRDDHADAIIEYLNKEEIQDRLKETQIDEIVEALSGNKAVINGIHLLAYKNLPLSSALAEVGRRIGSFDKIKGLKTDVLEALDDQKVADLSYGGGAPVLEALKRAETMDDVEMRDNTRIFKMILTGKAPVPTKAELEALPNCARILNTAAHAARHMTTLNDDSMQKGAYAILDLEIDVPNPIWWGVDASDMMYATGGVNLFLGYVMDNIGKLSSDALWACDTVITAKALANRRAFRFLDKQEDRQLDMLMDQVKMDQLNLILTSQTAAQDFKDNKASLVRYLDSNEEVINSLVKQWEPKYVKALADYHLPATMTLTDNGIIFSSEMAATIQALIPAVMAWDGPKLAPLSVDMENAFQLMIQAGNLLEKPLHLERKFDDDEFELKDVLDVSEHFRDYWAGKRFAKTKSFAQLLGTLDFNGEKADITHNMELVEHMGADAIGWIPEDKLPSHVKPVLGMISEMDLEPAIDALYSLVNALRVVEPKDVQEETESRLNMTDLVYPDEDGMDVDLHAEAMELYDAARQEIEDKVVDDNDRRMRLNMKLMEALEKVKDFVGLDDDIDYGDSEDEEHEAQPFEAEMPNVHEDQYAGNASRLRDLRYELKTALESNESEQEEWADSIGFDE